MGFIGVYRAIYDYAPTSAGELAISDNDLLFILDKGEDDWWKAKKKAADEDEEEPEGLIPANYVEEAQPLTTAKALYDYARQTDEEVSFEEDDVLKVYDRSDPDWTLVGAKGEYGFAPANYIEDVDDSAGDAPPTPARARPVPAAPMEEPEGPPTPESSPSPVQQTPAAALAGIIQQRTGGGVAARRPVSPPPNVALPPRNVQFTPEESEEEAAPRLPQRPPSEITSPASPPAAASRNVRFQSPTSPEPPSVIASPPHNRHVSSSQYDDEPMASPGGYHIYNIYEMVEVLGKSKKMPVTLGINIAKGIIMISAEKERSQKEWTADKLSHYSIEGKHVFMELVRPTRSIDFHAGAKDTAQEIVGALGELAGAIRAGGAFQEVLQASAGTGNTLKKGKMIYEFMAQGDDEVTVAEGDEVIVLDDSKSDEWWMVRRMKNGKEGVVPSNYVDIIGTVPNLGSPPPMSPAMASPVSAPIPQQSHRSIIEQNRAEEERLAKQAAKRKKEVDFAPPSDGQGLQLPKRHSSLMAPTEETKRRDKRASKDAKGDKKSMPNASKLRTWTDRSGSFKVEAEFLGLRDEKIHLHKTNGVKIAVPVPKMSVEDLEFVERATGISLDELKPLSDIKRKSSKRGASGASVQKKEQHDWFDFFLGAGIDPQICERYGQAFNRDNIGEENLEDITPSLLRTLGFKEGDILRVMKALDAKFSRERKVPLEQDVNGSLFSGPGGALKNNKTRPTTGNAANNELDPSLLRQGTGMSSEDTSKQATPLATAPKPTKQSNGFDDNAWDNRPSRNPTASPPPVARTETPPAAQPAPPSQPSVTPGMAEMSLLSAPLQPTPAPQPTVAAPPPAPVVTPPPQQPAQPSGASPSLFEQLAKAPPQQPKQRPNQPQQPSNPALNSLISPPPGRSASAPQNPQQTGQGFQPPPLQPQLTGYNLPLRMQAQPGQGSSLLDIDRQRILLQQQNEFLRSQPTGFGGQFGGQQNGLMPQPTGFQPQGQFGGFGGMQLQPQPTGFQPNPNFQQAMQNGAMNGSPFADSAQAPFRPQATGFGGQPGGFGHQGGIMPQATGVNAFLPPALVPQATGMPATSFNNGPPQNQFGQNGGQFGQNGYGGQNNFSPPPVPPIPQDGRFGGQQGPALQPLVPQKTGPPPPVRFGTNPAAKRLVSQPTGRANLSKATAQNPFGFG